jgi:hypothetical protein
MKEQIKELRVKIDGLSQLVKELNFKGFIDQINNNKPSHELDKCYDSLILAKAWLGKVLGELGEATPYANDGKRKSIKDIEPTADTHFEINQKHIFGKEQGLISEEYLNFNHIEKVDWLRQEIQSIINFNSNVELNFDSISRSYFIWAFKYLCEARFWLGFELGKIKESGIPGNNI